MLFYIPGRSPSLASSFVSSDSKVEVLEGRVGPPTNLDSCPVWRYGTYGCGLNLLPTVWARHQLAFEVDPSLSPSGPIHPPHRNQVPGYHPARAPKDLLNQFPLDILVADHSSVTQLTSMFGSDHDQGLDWHHWLRACSPDLRPKVIVQLWPAWALWRDPGPTSKHSRKPLERLGYDLRYRVLDATMFGGPVSQKRLVIVCFQRISSSVLDAHPKTSVRRSPCWDFLPEDMGYRPMSNCLRPTGAGPTRDSLPSDQVSVPHAARDPMPSRPGSWIETDRGFRRLHADELAKGLGVPRSWSRDPLLTTNKCVDHLVGVHLWEGISHSLETLWPEVGMAGDSIPVTPTTPTGPPDPPGVPTDPVPPSSFPSQEGSWHWDAPDLSLSGAWYRNRIRNLKRASKCYPENERKAIIDHGKADLAIHRQNYGPDGARQLQLLWWEFPKEHWEPLRLGSSMNFLKDPRTGLTPNAKLDDTQQAVAGEFVDELIALKIIRLAPADDPILANCPLFVVPKPGQPGQWRIIADCKKGGQNEAMGPNPVFLPQAHFILHQMYSGGWTAVIDASKFFYQFPTVISERKFLGLIHPVTGAHYHYCGLPMGTASSPGIACAFGTGFLRRLRQRHPEVFGGTPTENTWRRHVSDHIYDDRLGHGRAVVSSDGLPAVLTTGFVDDFSLHGPTYEKTSRGLDCFMDYAVEVGLLCNPDKVYPPSQETKYCGFIFDTRGVPTLRVPEGKRSRARAMVDYLLANRGTPIPRLSLVVVTGILESQVPATPSQLGHTYLRRLYDAIWASDKDLEPLASARDRYYFMVDLTVGAWDDLLWWQHHLQHSSGRAARPSRSATLVAHFGDGSGTGTGGTTQTVGGPYHDPAPLDMWMGRWSDAVHSFSSNWRELKTLELTLRRELERGDHRARDTTLFYFTDNLVTYYVVNGGSARSPTLQDLLYTIKSLELELGCMLEVVHIPGTTIIDQGADDLSRGVWLSTHREYIAAPILIPKLFASVHLQDDWLGFLRQHIPGFPQTAVDLRTWDSNLDDGSLFGRCTLWAPPVEMAVSILMAVVLTWTEQPSTTSAVVLLPWVLQRQWQRMTRHLIPLRPLPADDSPHKRDCFSFLDPTGPVYHRLPIVMLYLPPHTPTLPVDRLDPTPSSIPWRRRRWFEHQKDLLYGLS